MNNVQSQLNLAVYELLFVMLSIFFIDLLTFSLIFQTPFMGARFTKISKLTKKFVEMHLLS